MSSDPSSSRAVPIRALALSIGLLPLACRPPESSPPAPAGEEDLSVRVIQPRRTPRSAFDLRLRAEELGGSAYRLILTVESPRGGTGRIEFSLPEGFEVIDGFPARDLRLEPGEVREEAITVGVPPSGDRAVAATAIVDGRREEAYVVFGDPPSAENRGIRIRRRPDGEGVLRIDPAGTAR